MGNISYSDKNYDYKGLPLTPSIIEELILELFSGKILIRQTIVDEVVKFHEINGGTKSIAQDVPRSIKKALENLKIKGKADNPTYGYWKIYDGEFGGDLGENEPVNDLIPDEIEIPIADKVFGEGTSAIYLYYLPMYRLKAEQSDENKWHCKIGKTNRDPLLRVLSQAATALPEKPHISIIFKTNFPNEFENVIHSILTIKGRKIDNSPGSEWFLTSPDEVEKLIQFINTGLN